MSANRGEFAYYSDTLELTKKETKEILKTKNIYSRYIKRILDVLLSTIGLVVLSPVFLLIAILIKIGSKGPIFFKHKRIGKNGKEIYIYKFRTMVENAEDLIKQFTPEQMEEFKTNFKLENDPRITKIGKFLRKTSLDEWPQFINVLLGEMSLIGPRPYLPREKKDMGQYYNSIIKCKPGVTGMWQANGRSDVEFNYRCKLDDYYYHNWSIWLDFTIIYKTIKGVVYGKGSL